MNTESLRKEIRKSRAEMDALLGEEANRVIIHLSGAWFSKKRRRGGKSTATAETEAVDSIAWELKNVIAELYKGATRGRRGKNPRMEERASGNEEWTTSETASSLSQLHELLRPKKVGVLSVAERSRVLGRVRRAATLSAARYYTRYGPGASPNRRTCAELWKMVEDSQQLLRILEKSGWIALLQDFLTVALQHIATKNDAFFLRECLSLVESIKNNLTLRAKLALATQQPVPELSFRYLRALEGTIHNTSLKELTTYGESYPNLPEAIQYLMDPVVDGTICVKTISLHNPHLTGIKGLARFASELPAALEKLQKLKDSDNLSKALLAQERLRSLTAEHVSFTRWVAPITEICNIHAQIEPGEPSYILRKTQARRLYCSRYEKACSGILLKKDAPQHLDKIPQHLRVPDKILASILNNVHALDRTVFDIEDVVTRQVIMHGTSTASACQDGTADDIALNALVSDYVEHLLGTIGERLPEKEAQKRSYSIDVAAALIFDTMIVLCPQKFPMKTTNYQLMDVDKEQKRQPDAKSLSSATEFHNALKGLRHAIINNVLLPGIGFLETLHDEKKHGIIAPHSQTGWEWSMSAPVSAAALDSEGLNQECSISSADTVYYSIEIPSIESSPQSDVIVHCHTNGSTPNEDPFAIEHCTNAQKQEKTLSTSVAHNGNCAAQTLPAHYSTAVPRGHDVLSEHAFSLPLTDGELQQYIEPLTDDDCSAFATILDQGDCDSLFVDPIMEPSDTHETANVSCDFAAQSQPHARAEWSLGAYSNSHLYDSAPALHAQEQKAMGIVGTPATTFDNASATHFRALFTNPGTAFHSFRATHSMDHVSGNDTFGDEAYLTHAQHVSETREMPGISFSDAFRHYHPVAPPPCSNSEAGNSFIPPTILGNTSLEAMNMNRHYGMFH